MSIPPQPWVIVPGNHDGVHRGHQQLLREAASHAQGAAVVPLFFDPHPARVLRPDKAPEPLTTPARRIELLMRAGASHVVCEPFDQTTAHITPAAFAKEVLKKRLGASLVVVGPDFRFGYQRAGDVAALRKLGEIHGFSVHEVEIARDAGERISSSLIREQLKGGDVVAAAGALGRFHDVESVVVEGQRRGRTIGFPTANLGACPTLLPGDGVYAVVVRVLDGSSAVWGGAANLGVRPTVAAGRSAEVHLFDFQGDCDSLYGRRLRVGFVSRIRNEQKFDSIEALKRQIALDVSRARRLSQDALEQDEVMAWF